MSFKIGRNQPCQCDGVPRVWICSLQTQFPESDSRLLADRINFIRRLYLQPRLHDSAVPLHTILAGKYPAVSRILIEPPADPVRLAGKVDLNGRFNHHIQTQPVRHPELLFRQLPRDDNVPSFTQSDPVVLSRFSMISAAPCCSRASAA